MKYHKIVENKRFIGRVEEFDRLKKIDESIEAEIIIVYGRRRIGKTELIEQFFRQHKVLKF